MGAGDVRLLVLRDGAEGRWLFAVPVGTRRLGLILKARTSWASEYAPLGTPLLHPSLDGAALGELLRAAAGQHGLFAVPYLPVHGRVASRLLAAAGSKAVWVARQERAGHGSGANGKAQLAEADSGKRRKEMRRLLRRLGDHGKVRFSSVDGPGAVYAFETFLELEASGWKGRTGTALLSRADTAAFARGAVANRAATGGVRIDCLHAGQVPVAALVLFRAGGRVFSWKIAFDETFARYSPGAQIALQAMKTNLETPGFAGADSLAVPGHSMIEPLWRGRLETGTLLVAQGPFGTPLRTLLKADIALERSLRRGARALKRRLTG